MPRKLNLDRAQAFDARPVSAKIIDRQPLPRGGAMLTIEQRPAGVYRWLLRMPETIPKKFELDEPGLEVLAMCDGKQTVNRIIATFARSRRLNEHEARQAVVIFLQTMMRKGLVTMIVPKRGR